jgi:hypothetical protein
VYKFSAKFDGRTRSVVMSRVNAAAEAFARFEYSYFASGLCEGPSGSQPGGSCADNQNLFGQFSSGACDSRAGDPVTERPYRGWGVVAPGYWRVAC